MSSIIYTVRVMDHFGDVLEGNYNERYVNQAAFTASHTYGHKASPKLLRNALELRRIGKVPEFKKMLESGGFTILNEDDKL